MRPPIPGANQGPPDVGELRDLIDQWYEFAASLEVKDYTFDLDNWRNDVDVRELILEALPMFSREEIGDHALKLDQADAAFKTGTLKPWRVELLDELGMVWSVADAHFMTNLTAARTYYGVHSTLAAPKDAAADGVAVGQWLANCRKTGDLGTNSERAAERRRRRTRLFGPA